MAEEIYIDAEAFTKALTALLPFTSKAKDDERPSEGYALYEVIHFNITNKGHLAASAFSATGNWAIALIPLTDYEGAITDFAIKRDEASLFLRTFKPRPKMEDLLKIAVDHTESTSQEKNQAGTFINYRRSTMLKVSEEGKLFGARISQFPGTDNRHLEISRLWAAVSAESILDGQPITEFALTPTDIKPIDQACKIYGEPKLTINGFNLLARFLTDEFIACCRIRGTHEITRHPAAPISTWAKEIFDNSEFFPTHTLQEQLTAFTEVNL